MIRSSVFSFDESSMWDPKVIREHLNIPEDQLIILNNIPEWNKGSSNGRTYVIEKDIGEYSQPSRLHISDITLQENQELNDKNIELFDKHFETRRSILETYKLNSQKFSKSVSLFEIDKIDEKLSNTNHLIRRLSVPNIYLFSKNLYSETLNIEFENKDSSPKRHSLSTTNVDLPHHKESEISNICKQRIEDKNYIEKSNMNVVSQLPINITSNVDKGKSNEIMLENHILSTGDTLQSSDNLSNSEDQLTFPASTNILSNDNLDVNEKATKLAVNEDLNSNEKNKTTSCIIKEKVLGNSDESEKISKLTESEDLNLCEEKGTTLINDCNQNASEKATELIETGSMNSNEENKTVSCIIKEIILDVICNSESAKDSQLAESESLNSCQQNKSDSFIVKDIVPMAITNSENKNADVNIEAKKLTKVSETSDNRSEPLDISKEQHTSEINVICSNEPEKNSNSLQVSEMDINGHKIIEQKVDNDKSVPMQTLSVKRKLESRNKSSKRRRSTREKHGRLEERSLEKAGEICYSVECIKSMLDIMKQFV